MERQILLSHGWGMGDSDVREREGRSRRAGSPVSDLVASKLRRPLVRGGTVSRSVLMERLARGDRRPIVSVVAPPGYGKTTVLSQWAEHNGQAFAWVSVDERDNDPKALLAIARGAWEAGERLLSEAWSLARDADLEDYPLVTILHAAAARMALHKADRPRVIAELTRAQRLRPGLTYALPYLAVQARVELARCYLALADAPAARVLLQEAAEILTRRPGLGTFARQAEDLRAELAKARGSSAPGASALTAAELRLLPMLLTHLSFPQIAGEMFLSPNTVKSQAMSVYRKLGASSRREAVTRSRELGLLEA